MDDEFRAWEVWLREVYLSGTGTLDWMRAGPWLDKVADVHRELQQLRDERDERDAGGRT
ncbi:hypothetical protein BJG93_35320 [Paraburkholderia sprentiae WSM5005]|uniref:Uncharacterized protein n=1 Tax=Paraburkholderia sprentiae WSM5005 TaxID=754502 RepID=A0A8F4QIL9_9BURK|nr:hypothetical protein [Paraburkholderia sprentiae]QXE07129.1 hypothetical protein BJG93_35320 [Paraburkholderia sprentiae WSM5005]